MERERKWMVSGWPEREFPLLKEQLMRQGYICPSPTVRIREERSPEETDYVLCFKSVGLLARKEIEISIAEEKFRELEDLIGLPLIQKIRRTFALPNGLKLEVNHVDEGLPTEFWYTEIEFDSEEEARAFDPASVGLMDYLNDDVTEQEGQSMSAYWVKTRLRGDFHRG